MWKTITKLVQLLGMFLAWTLRMDGSISVMLRFIYWIIFLSHFALYWCNTGVVSAIGVHFTECLQRVSGCSLFSEQWAAGMSIRNLEIWLIHHGTLTFQYYKNGIFNFCLCVTYYACRRSCYGSICSLNHHFKCLFVFQCIYRENAEKNISVSYVCLKLQ